MSEGKRLPERLLLGPGPSNVPLRVREAISRPLVGHLDPEFLKLMSELQELLRWAYRTKNRMTIPISGTGTAGMECAVYNFVEEGDAVLVGVHGYFGGRIAEMARRAGAEVTVVSSPFGEPLDVDALSQAADRVKPKVIAFVHAETSTGVLQPVQPIREICDRHGALLLADCVTSLAGHPLEVDEWGMDICFAGTQKCLNCPPGLAPLTASERAMQKLRARKSKVHSWYFDLSLLDNYWGEKRSYHHTAPIAMNNALREALLIVQEDGLEVRWDRHKRHHLALVAGIEALGLKMHVDPAYRLWPLNTVRVPSGIDEAAVRARLLSKFNLEVGAGLGDLAGKVLRIGLMGLNSSMENVLIVLHALEECLSQQGYSCPPGAGVRAASEALR